MRQLVVTGGFPLSCHNFVTREVKSTIAAGELVHVLAANRGDDAGAADARTLGLSTTIATYARYATTPVVSFDPQRFRSKIVRAANRSVFGLELAERRKTLFCRLTRNPHVRSANLVHTHFVGWGVEVGVPLAQVLGVPVTVTAHNAELAKRPVWQLKFLQQNASTVVAVSRAQKRLWARLTGSEERLVVVRNAVLRDEFAPAPTWQQRAEIRLVTISRLVGYKRVADVVESVARLASQGISCRLDVFGDGPERPKLDLLAASLGVGDRITLRGNVPHAAVLSCLRQADILVHASEDEPFGLAVLEGMASWLPVVAAAADGPKEIVDESVTGFLYPPGDIGALTEHLAQLAASPGLRRRLGEAGRSRAENEFSWERHMSEMLAVWHAALDRS
jgi:glycosyltransferase involved in cell wall biosynthesis